MREILFRGKGINDGKWIEGYVIRGWYFDGSEFVAIVPIIPYIPNHYDVQGVTYRVDPNTVSEFTGLTDKNGKKIFEGDIILFEDESPTNYEYHDCTEMRCGDVRFDDGEFYLTNRIAVEMGDLIYDGKLDGVIVGNIHDNPELLKGGE